MWNKWGENTQLLSPCSNVASLVASSQQESMPFAVVGSDKEYQVNGKRVLGRKTPWGVIEGKQKIIL